ncbi:hypothetical protein ACUY3R_04635 [Corynebacterium sp. 23_3061]|uniref:hypothetical protein n=1 Tax=Corynebacterium TaxID=1716 RepID=UPI00195A53A6|nr:MULTISPECIES: hypothetical protein [Corynebacterium]MDN8624259.1 hypothetical protein [Corynebacterium kroppenstedtii]QRQ65440.1 hypothetical protein I6J23_03025 [Corynebacterium kroppenstedtii]
MATRDPEQHSSGTVTAGYEGEKKPATDKAAQSVSTRPSAITSWMSALSVAVIFAIGGWQRRWMSDDGLIVLRTVRNLLAGNGPVFNAGERVEANTSVMWQYIIYGIATVSSARLETIAIYTGLFFSVLAVTIAAMGSAALHRSPGVLFVPCGLLLYICLPPARDFATSGLEWGLSIFWIAVLWFLMAHWDAARHWAYPGSGSVSNSRSHQGRQGHLPRWSYALAFWAGLSWLVRPELALYGAATIVVLLVIHRRWTILAWAVPLPFLYEIFRAGYYGLLVPNTAIAKSASGSDWKQGWRYVLDFANPYWLWLIIPIAIIVGIALFRVDGRHAPLPVIIMVSCGVLHVLYIIRIGGDFMHGRMCLLPLFALVMPIAVVPIRYASASSKRTQSATWDGSSRHNHHGRLLVAQQPLATSAIIIIAGCASMGIWGIVRLCAGHPFTQPTTVADFKHLDIVDEREFWTAFTGHSAHDPLTKAEDFLAAPTMINYTASLEGSIPHLENSTHSENPDKGVTPEGFHVQPLASIPTHPYKDIRSVWTPLPNFTSPEQKQALSKFGKKSSRVDATTSHSDDDLRTASGLDNSPVTVSYINLGMTSMNAPLDVRVVDPMGLANPLAARQSRQANARIGHDKSLPLYWQLADTAVPVTDTPFWESEKKVHAARIALHDSDFVSLFEAYRSPMSLSRFVKNIGFALTQGHSLTFSSKPSDYTTNTTTEDTQPNSVPVIQWGHRTKLDSGQRLPRSLHPDYIPPATTVFRDAMTT